MIRLLSKSKLAWFFFLYFLFIFIWWIRINLGGLGDTIEAYWFNLIYGVAALIGGVNGLVIAYRKWGGHKSIIGKGLLFLSLGLLGQWFGNAMWGYGNLILNEPLPYPGPADIGYFSIIPFYALAIYHFALAGGINFQLRNLRYQLLTLFIAFLAIIFAWTLFIKDIPFDPSNPIRLFLDYGYPAGETIVLSLTLITYSLCRNILGGKMKSRLLFVFVALLSQDITDYSFLYTAGIETYFNGSFVDLFYATSIIIMALCLLSFSRLDE